MLTDVQFPAQLWIGGAWREAGSGERFPVTNPATGERRGDARAIGKVLTEHPAVRAISLTGSTETGAEIMSAAGKHVKRTSMELGGNSPFIVLPDADLERAADDLIRVKFMANGQLCVTANRVFAHESLFDRFTALVLERVRALKLGDCLNPDTNVGPLISPAAVAGVNKLVEDAVAHGAKLLHGGLAALPPELSRGSVSRHIPNRPCSPIVTSRCSSMRPRGGLPSSWQPMSGSNRRPSRDGPPSTIWGPA